METPGPSTTDWTSDDDGEEDEVVGEIDVFVSKAHSDSLYLLQYPLRPSDQPLTLGVDQHQDITCEFKPKQEKLQLKFPLNVGSSSYDRSRGEQIAVNCGASSSTPSKGKPPPFERMMDYQCFVSSPVAGFHKNCYAVGYFQNDQLHLTPMRNILQMRPSFSYLDAADARSSSKSQADATGESSQDESETEAGTSGTTQVQTVRVKFKEESEYLRKRREASYQYQQNIKDEEPAIPLRFISAQDEGIRKQKNLLMGNVDWTVPAGSLEASTKDLEQVGRPSVGFHSTGPKLLRLLAPNPEEQKATLPKGPSTVISLNQLRLLPLPDQVRTLMTNVKVLRFSQLMSLLPPKADLDTVLKNLQQCAQLVQGCWVVKSEILHPKGSFSPRTGASADLLCRARDYAMYRFTQTTTLTRREIAYAVKIPNEDIDDILAQLARFKVQSGWHFMYPADTDFVQSYPDISQQQSAKWEAKFKELSQHLTVPRQRHLSSSASSSSPSRRRRTDSGRNSTTEPDTDSRLMSPPPSGAVSSTRRRRSSSSATKRGAKLSTVDQPENCNGVTSSTTNYDQAVITELKNFLYDAFCTKPVLSLARIQLQLQVKLSESPKDHPLSKCMDERLIEECAMHLGVAKFDKGQGEKAERILFAYAGGSWPELRAFLLKFLQDKSQGKKEKAAFRFSAFKQACTSHLSSDYTMPTDNEMKYLILEYCVQKPGGYFALQDS